MRMLAAATAVSALVTLTSFCGTVAAEDNVFADLTRCGQLANGGDYSEGVRVCGRVISAGNREGVLMSTVYFYRAMAFRGVGDLGAAIRDFDTALLLAPVSVYHVERGAALQANGDLDAAIADFDTALRMRPDDARVYGLRGEAHRLRGDLAAARLDFDAAHELAPDKHPLSGSARLAKESALKQ